MEPFFKQKVCTLDSDFLIIQIKIYLFMSWSGKKHYLNKLKFLHNCKLLEK